MKMYKQIFHWNPKKLSILKSFREVEKREGGVRLRSFMNEMGISKGEIYGWRKYCIDNGIIEGTDFSEYNTTEFGEWLLECGE